MSYILDALRKADAERARGSVPGLHAQPVAGVDGAEAAPRRLPWRWVTWAALAVLLGALGWWAGRQSAPATASAPTPALTPAPPPVPDPVAMAPAEPQSPVAAAAVPTSPAIVLPASPTVPSPDAPPVAQVAPLRAVITLPEAAPTPVPVPVPVPAPARPENAAKAANAMGAAAAASAPPPVASRVPLLAELPADLRRQLPTLTVGGSVYSDRPASRFVMINGQLLHEGDTVAPGLVLESLRPKSAVFVFRGQRFEMPY